MAEARPARDQAAITGVGLTPFSRNSGKPPSVLAFEACDKAVRDAGLTRHDIDGVFCYGLQDSVSPRDIATGMGLGAVGWVIDVWGGGDQACAIIAQAAMVIANRLCKHVLCYRALNGRSGLRMGRLRTGAGGQGVPGVDQFMAPFGSGGPPQGYAMMTRRHMYQYGTTSDQLGTVAVTLRSNAVLNQRAIMRTPLTLEDYHNSRWVAEPFHLLDCCLETDAACAMVVSRADLAKDMPHHPAYVMAYAYGGGPGLSVLRDKYPDFTVMFPKFIAPGLFQRAGIGVWDVDVAQIYDAYTFAVLCQLEDFGFCQKGDGGPFIAEGNISLKGRIPVGTNGGLLSEGYIHGFNNVAEAVYQLRGACGQRQVKDAEVVLCSGFGGNIGSAMLLHR